LLQKQLDSLGCTDSLCLDIGCGTGLAEELFHPLSRPQLVGVDVAATMLRIASKRCADAFYACADGLKLPFANGTFDLTFSFALMHHLSSDEKRREVLKEMARVTKENGRICTFEHNPLNPFVNYLVKKCGVDEGVELIPPDKMIDIHNSVGLHVIDVEYLVFSPSRLGFLERAQPFVRHIPVGGQYEIVAGKK